MRFLSKLILSLLILPAWASAQDTLISDKGAKAPFQGRISYQISYSGEKAQTLSAYLPDSVDFWFAPDFIRGTYYGGLSDSLAKDILWDRKSGQTWLLHPLRQSAWSLPADSLQSPKPKVRKYGNPEKVLNIPAQRFTFTDGDAKHNIWLADSLLYPYKASDTALSQVPAFIHPELKGLPLKFSTRTDLGTSSLIATEVVPGTLPPSKGQIPSHYRREDFKEFTVRHPLLER